MRLCTLVLCIWLLPKVNTLRCYECLSAVSGTCADEIKECPLQSHQCNALKVLSYVGQSKVADMTIKACALAQECINGSVNFGISKVVMASKCCTSDLCNREPASVSSFKSPNGKKCFSCDGEMCTNELNCEGSEDHCIKATIKTGQQIVTMKGCASKMMCTAEVHTQLAQSLGQEFSCCQGNLCNSGGSARAGLLLLVVPLISLVLFS